MTTSGNLKKAIYHPVKIGLAGFFIMMLWSIQNVYSQGIAPDIVFNPKRYVCHKITSTLVIDGHLDEPVWTKALWTDKFIDIQGDGAPTPRFNTRVKMLWDDSFLYVAARLQEPHLWATLTERDAVIFHNNNFEVFIDPDGDTHHYYELEVNALGTYWDLMLTKPYRDGGKAIDSWDMRNLGIGIQIDGTLNDPSDADEGWTVELAIPWKDVSEASSDGKKPSIGEQWRINFSRVEWKLETKDGSYIKKRDGSGNVLPEDNWVWSPQGLINMHYPEMWGFVQFGGAQNQTAEFEWNDTEYIKWYLRRLYYRQHNFYKKKGKFTSGRKVLKTEETRDALNLSALYPGLSLPRLTITPHTFEIQLKDKQTGTIWYIRENGRVWSRSPGKSN